MKTYPLKEIIDKWDGKEGEHLEFKLSSSGLSKDIWETVSAFSNEGGGMILVGYEKMGDKYIPAGVKNPAKILDDFTSTVSQKFNFCPVVSANIVEHENKPVIVIEVKEAPRYQKPIYIKDAGPIKGGFKRVGATDIRLTDEDIHRYYLERLGAPDAQPITGSTLDDIDPATLAAFRNLRRIINANAPELRFDDKGLLKAYNLLSKDSDTITAAGLLLFGKEGIVKRHFPAVRLDIIRIKGIEWGKDRDPFLSKDLIGNLITLRSLAADFLDRFFLVPFHTDKRGERIEENAHRKALREALTNLLMHQNYFHHSPSQIRVYNDRVEFYNPGYSLKDPTLFRQPGSKLRNPSIASVFYDIGWAEAKGTGLKTTIELLKSEGYPIPEYLNDIKRDTFTLVLPHPMAGIPQQVAPQVAPQVTPQVDVMDRIAATIKFCETPRSLKEIMQFLNLKDRKHFMEAILNPLLQQGQIQRTVPDKPRSRHQKYVARKEDKDK